MSLSYVRASWFFSKVTLASLSFGLVAGCDNAGSSDRSGDTGGFAGDTAGSSSEAGKSSVSKGGSSSGAGTSARAGSESDDGGSSSAGESNVEARGGSVSKAGASSVGGTSSEAGSSSEAGESSVSKGGSSGDAGASARAGAESEAGSSSVGGALSEGGSSSVAGASSEAGSAGVAGSGEIPTGTGYETDTFNRYSYVVALDTGCSGVLVSSGHVLTAAHCVCGVPSDAGSCATIIPVSIETVNGLGEPEYVEVSSIVVHPDFVMETSQAGLVTYSNADLAILTPATPLSPSLGFVYVASNDALSGQTVASVGFAGVSCQPDGVSNDLVRAIKYNSIKAVGEDKLTVGPLSSTSGIAFPGDSGGPLLRSEVSEDGSRSLVVAGITSTTDCETYSGSTFTNAFTYKGWIDDVIASSQVAVCGDGTCAETELDCCSDCGCAGSEICNSETQVCTAPPVQTCEGNVDGWYCYANSELVIGDGEYFDTDLIHCVSGAELETANCSEACEINPADMNDTCLVSNPCGNGRLDAGESCDSTNLNGATCASQGFDGGTLVCGDTCSFATSGCCEDACSGTTQCSGTVEQTCEDGDGDGCKEWVNTATCPLTCVTEIASSLCETWTSASGGGEIFEVCGEMVGDNRILIHVRKNPASTFGTRPYGVRVFGTSDPECSHETFYYTSPANVSVTGIGTTELEIEYEVLWSGSQTEKRYCAYAEAVPSDDGYSASDEAMSIWWYSRSLSVKKVCN